MTSLAAPSMIAPPDTEALMVRKAQVFIHAAIDLWLGELARRGRAATTRDKYKRIIDPFGDTVQHKLIDEITLDDLRRYLDRWVDKTPYTRSVVTVLRQFFEFCRDENLIVVSPADRLKMPPRRRAEDLDVVTISSDDVGRMLNACADWQELICIYVLAFMGVRRSAAANARRRDVDLESGHIRFREKGGKIITKPVPTTLLEVLRAADQQSIWLHGDDWLIPNRKPWLVKSKHERGSKLIYETVQRVADRARVRAHPHAFRAAFAVQYDEQHPDQLTALKELMGHSQLETTKVYLRRKDRAAAMETVRDLRFPVRALIPPAGFEPAFPPSGALDRDATETGAASLPDVLLDEARSRAKAKESSSRVADQRKRG